MLCNMGLPVGGWLPCFSRAMKGKACRVYGPLRSHGPLWYRQRACIVQAAYTLLYSVRSKESRGKIVSNTFIMLG
jgi:hypothetical protein